MSHQDKDSSYKNKIVFILRQWNDSEGSPPVKAALTYNQTDPPYSVNLFDNWVNTLFSDSWIIWYHKHIIPVFDCRVWPATNHARYTYVMIVTLVWGIPTTHGCFYILGPWDMEEIIWHVYFSKSFLWIDIVSISYEIILSWVPKNPIGDASALPQVMSWCREGNKTLPESMLTQIYVTITIWHN